MNNKQLLEKIKRESLKLSTLTYEQIKEKAIEIQQIPSFIIRNNLDFYLINWFSLIQQLTYRIFGIKYYEPQILAGICLHQAKIVQMNTGEGKTLVSALPVSFI